VAISFVAGLMLGLATLGLMPHGLQACGSLHSGAAWLLTGFVVLFMLQRFLPFHHHDVIEGNPLEPCGHAHSLAERSARTLSWIGVAVGLSLHSIIDGVAMAAAVTSSGSDSGGALGLGTALAVILHKPFGALAITTLMTAGGSSRSAQRLVNVAFASITPIGALLFFAGAAPLVEGHPGSLGAVLCFCAGTFICIAASDLLPELQFHRHDRLKLSLALVAGLAVAWAIVSFAHPAHAADEHHSAELDDTHLAPRQGRHS
jgi:zinc and cadmium transporter